MKLTRSLTALALTIGLAACGSDDLTEEESQQAFSAALGVAFTGTTEVSTSADGSMVSATYQCPGGGQASFSGTFDDANQSFDFTIRYEGCVSEGITIDGEINYAGQVNDTSSTVTMDGNLDFSGSVEGSCEIDVDFSSSATGFDYSGSICGYDASIAG